VDPRATSIRAGYATLADAYADHLLGELAGKPLDRGFLGAFADETRGAGLVVDLGCGPGQVARFLADHGVTVEGLDLSPEMVAEAAARHPGLSFRVGDMFALPYADASLAGVVAFYAIVHTPTAELLTPLRELHRVVAPRGLVAVAFHVGAAQTHVDELWGRATSLDFWFHPVDAVAAALAEAGFTLEARLEREPYPDVEYPSKRAYLLARRASTAR
jgi:SAM-dependent methyltransferase